MGSLAAAAKPAERPSRVTDELAGVDQIGRLACGHEQISE
jgi:hypothetical protein